MFKRIERDPFEGKPVIKGTHIPVLLILELLAKSLSVKEVLEKYPELTEENIREALKYAS